MSGHQKIIALQLVFTNTNCFYKIFSAKLLALNVLSGHQKIITLQLSVLTLTVSKKILLQNYQL